MLADARETKRVQLCNFNSDLYDVISRHFGKTFPQFGLK